MREQAEETGARNTTSKEYMIHYDASVSITNYQQREKNGPHQVWMDALRSNLLNFFHDGADFSAGSCSFKTTEPLKILKAILNL